LPIQPVLGEKPHSTVHDLPLTLRGQKAAAGADLVALVGSAGFFLMKAWGLD